MKKDLIFTPAILLICVLLFMLRATGMTAHIAISVLGVLLLIAYTILTKKDWKIPALEIMMRAFYGIALITGIIIMNIQGIAAFSIIHKTSAVIFMALIIVLLTHIFRMKKEKKELIKKFKVVIEDLLDNYEEYTDEEKAQIKEIFQKAADLNAILDKYDIDVKLDWQEYSEAYNQYFGMMIY